MTTVTGSQSPSNEAPQGNAAKDEAARAAQMDPAQESVTNARKEAPRQESTRESTRGDPRPGVGASEKPARPVIPMGSDESPAKPSTGGGQRGDGEQLAPLFAQNMATEYRERWVVVQQGFVDDPRRAVQQGDELVTQVMKNLADTFSRERAALENKLSESDDASTELLRVALRRYRSFFERLLSF
jgi:hypothetical protein